MARLDKAYSVGVGLQGVLPPPIEASAAPTSSNIKFPLGQIWLDTVNGNTYILNKVSGGAATWSVISPSAGTAVETLTGDSGGALSPTAGNITVAGGDGFSTSGTGSTLTINSAAPSTYTLFEDDFLLGDVPWSSSTTGSGSGIAQIAGASNHPGITELTAAGTGACALRSERRQDAIAFGGGFLRWEAIVMIPTLSDGTNRFDVTAGFGDAFNSSFHDNGIYLYYRDNVNSGQWVGRTENSGSVTDVNSAVTVGAGTWYLLAIEVNAGATSVEFFVNGTSIGTSSTNIPSAAGLHFGMDEQVGTTARTMQVDYCKMHQTFSSSRT